MKKNFPILLILLCVVLMCVILIFKNYQFRKELSLSKRIIEINKNTNLDLSQLEKVIDQYLLADLSKGNYDWNLVLIFSPEDCPYCLKEISFLGELKNKKKNLGCWGLVNHPHKELVSDFVRKMGWKFPICIIEKTYFEDNFGLGKTPIKVLIGKNKQIYYAEGPLVDWEKDGKLKEFIISAL